MKAALAEVRDGWPAACFAAARRPVECGDATEYLEQVLLGSHSKIIVLRGGAAKLGLRYEAVVPAWLRSAAAEETSVLAALRRVAAEAPDAARAHTARVEYVDRGVQREVPCRRGSGAGHGGEPDAWRSLASKAAAAAAAVDAGVAGADDLYVCEMQALRRWKREGRWTRSLCEQSQRAVFGDAARWTLAWDDEHDGVFLGARGAGKGLHVDQVGWSNVGVNWCGYKVVATWDPERAPPPALADAPFAPAGLAPAARRALEDSACVAVLGPGDAFVCSGGAPHATVVVGDGLNLTSYESLVTLEPSNVDVFLATPHRTFQTMPPDDFADYLAGCVANLAAVAKRPRLKPATTAFAVDAPTVAALEVVLRELYVDAVRSLAAVDPRRGPAPVLPPRVLLAARAMAFDDGDRLR